MKLILSKLKQNAVAAGRMLGADLKKYRVLIVTFILFCTGANLLFRNICMFRIATGYPCPGCGITRAFLLLLLLRWPEAFQMNPMIFVWVPLIAYAAFKRYFKREKMRYFTALFISAGLLSLLVYLVRMVLLYPSVSPMTYDSDNILQFLKNIMASRRIF